MTIQDEAKMVDELQQVYDKLRQLTDLQKEMLQLVNMRIDILVDRMNRLEKEWAK